MLQLEAIDIKPLAGTSFEITTAAARAEFVADSDQVAADVIGKVSAQKLALLKKVPLPLQASLFYKIPAKTNFYVESGERGSH